MTQEFMNHEEQARKIKTIIGKNARFTVNIDDLRRFSPKLAKYVLQNPIEAIKMFEDHLNQSIKSFKEDNGKSNNEKTM
jgi:DNA replicative helicase MCM subunit Mcm2 (Cdc46/Mcm family)